MRIDLSKSLSSYRKFFCKGLLIDNGPLMLIFYGAYDKKYGTNYIKKIGYDHHHYEALNRLINGVPTNKLVMTPHIFHEFYKHAQSDFDSKLLEFFKGCFDKLIKMEERHVHKNVILTPDLFIELELGEHSLICTCQADEAHAILHDDRKVGGKLKERGDILTISLKEEVLPLYLTTMG